MSPAISPRTSVLICLNLLLISAASFAQETKPAGATSGLIEKKTWKFVAQSMSPATGGVRQLNSTDFLKLNGDTLTCDLPYMGRVYQPTLGSSDGGLKFSSRKFTFESKPRKKGGWMLTLDTKDLPNNRRFSITVFEDGNASMSVNCSDRQSVSYRGYLTKP